MICSSLKRFFTSNLLGLGDWTPNLRATQNRGDVGRRSELKRLRVLEEENRKLKQLVADLSLDKAMLQEVVTKKL